MDARMDELLSIVESLPLDMRTKLVEKLLDSFHPTREEIDRLWAEEAERRVEQIEVGSAITIPGEKVFEKIREIYGK